MMPYIKIAGGLVTEQAGYTSHGAVVGVSLGIPTIVGAKDIVEKIKTGEILSINSSEGTISEGNSF